MRTRFFALLAALSIAALGIASCGGSGGGSTGTGTPVASKGVITGFGSVYINGVKYDTTSSGVIIDDSSVTVDNLKVGMVVKMKGTLNDDGVTGSASSIEYEDSLEGPVANLTATGFSVLGQNVAVTATTVFEGAANLAALANGQIVEVSGLSNPDGSITATRVEVKNSTEFKVRGTVSNLGATTFTLTVTPTIAFTVDYATAAIVPSAAALVNGAFVKVKAAAAPVGSTITATKVAIKQSGLEDSSRAELEGMVANFDSGLKTFTINGITVNASGIALAAGFGNGTRVEVKGPLSNGVLTAVKISMEKESDRDVQGTVSDKTATTLTVNGTVVTVTATTMYEDSGSRHDRMFSFASIAINDKLDVKGFTDASGNFTATRIERQ